MIRACFKVAGQACQFNVLEGPEDIPEFVRWIRSGKTFGLDTETSGLDWWADDFKLRLVQFGTEREAYVVPVELGAELLGAAVGAIRDVIRREGRLILQNATYDLLVLDATTDLRMEDVWPAVLDTKILAHLVDSRGEAEGGTGHGLESLTKHYIDRGTAAAIKASMGKLARDLGVKKGEVFKAVPWDNGIYLTYSALDPILAFRLGRLLLRKIPHTARNLTPFEHEVAEICSYMSRRGVRLDVDYTVQLSEKLYADELEWTQIARELGCENPWSTEQAADAFEARGTFAKDRTPSGKRKIDKKFLGELVRKGDLLALAIEQAKSARKKRNTWLKSFLDLVDSKGYIHPGINSIQARTARMSIVGVPAQTLPAGDAEIRNCFLADEGHCIVSVDYSNMELRFLAAHSGDRRMLKAFREGEDLHQITADAAGVSRKIGKMGNFLIVFGGGKAALVEQAGVSDDVAESVMNGFMETFPGVKRFMDDKTKEARRNGYITTPSGRRLYVDKSRAYSGANYFIQSGSRDITCRALVRMHRKGITPYMLLPIHDEVLFSVPIEKAEAAAKIIADLMAETIKGLEIPTDPEIGRDSWGSLYDLEDTKH
ncbi:DNA polymerase [Streptomyces sp. NPDC002120]|uniref:DNA polymerase n=1 Tax=Streptomyces sp. NPDC002120 TaxID=3364631 RepID=UPI0036B2485F